MPKKSARVDAFVDESIRGQTYYLCAVLVPLEQQSHLRILIRQLAKKSNQRRLHFHNESRKKKTEVIELLKNEVEIIIVHAQINHNSDEEKARQKCVKSLILELQKRGIRRVIIERRSNNRNDEITILKTRANGPVLEFIHLGPFEEELLWCADAMAWVYGAGTFWRSQIATVPKQEIEAS